jgi:hypothetical protein
MASTSLAGPERSAPRGIATSGRCAISNQRSVENRYWHVAAPAPRHKNKKEEAMERCTPRSLGRLSISLAVTVAFADLAAQATAGSAEERERERMQQELNEQVIAAPFSVEDDLPSRPSCRPTLRAP